MPPRKAAPDADKILSRRVLVTISRDQTTSTPRAVWQHEIPILEAIHGEGNVKVEDATLADEGYTPKPAPDLAIFNKLQDKIRKPSETLGLDYVFYGDHRTEFDRLCNLYDRHPDENKPFAEYVYGRFRDGGDFDRLLGRAELDDLPDEQLRTLVRDYGFVPVFDPNGTDEEKRLVRDKQKTLLTAAREQLLTFADELSIALS